MTILCSIYKNYRDTRCRSPDLQTFQAEPDVHKRCMNVSCEGLGATGSRWNRFSAGISASRFLLPVARFLLRDNRVLNGLLGTFYPNLSPLRNVSLIYDGGLSSLIHQPFTGMVNPARLGFTAMGSTLFVLVWETKTYINENLHRSRFGLSSHLSLHRDVEQFRSWTDNRHFFIIYFAYWSIENVNRVLHYLSVSLIM